jgi:hypothetical protein
MSTGAPQSSLIRPVLRPPGREPGNIPRLIVPPGLPTILWIFSPEPFGLEVHWDGLRNRPCQAHQGACWYDHALSGPKWEAWLHVGRNGDRVGNLLCISDCMANQYPPLGDGTEDLRGLRLTVWRRGETTHTAVLLKAERVPVRLENFPPPCDLRRRVQMMYDAPLRPGTVQRLARQGRVLAPALAEGEIRPDADQGGGPEPEPGAAG